MKRIWDTDRQGLLEMSHKKGFKQRGETVGFGGSMTIEQMGLYEKLQNHNTVFWHWRIPEGKTDKEVRLEANGANANLFL